MLVNARGRSSDIRHGELRTWRALDPHPAPDSPCLPPQSPVHFHVVSPWPENAGHAMQKHIRPLAASTHLAVGTRQARRSTQWPKCLLLWSPCLQTPAHMVSNTGMSTGTERHSPSKPASYTSAYCRKRFHAWLNSGKGRREARCCLHTDVMPDSEITFVSSHCSTHDAGKLEAGTHEAIRNGRVRVWRGRGGIPA